jgi:hypothetical protein
MQQFRPFSARKTIDRHKEQLFVLLLCVATLSGIFALYGQEAHANTADILPQQGPYPPPPTPTPSPTPSPTPTYLQLFSISPDTASSASETTVTVRGAGFQGVPTLNLGSYALNNVTRSSSTQITAVVPAGLPPGVYDLILTNPDGNTVLLAQAFSASSSGLAIRAVQPPQGTTGIETTLNVFGFNFASGAVVRLEGSLLATTRIDATFLRAVVPPALPAGTYDLSVTNPDNSTAAIADAYTILPRSTENDDLYAGSSQLVSEPVAPRAGTLNKIALVVTRQGGRQPIDVTVQFFAGNPADDGTSLGRGSIVLLSPRSSESTSFVNWTPPTAGSYTLYAILDPDNTVPESLEGNNVVSRTLTVLPSANDQLAPRVERFTIDGGAATTTDLAVQLEMSASDPLPSSGMKSLLYQEFEFSPGASQWIPVRNSGWLDYAAARTNYPWQLLASPGMKYLQAWAADQSGNIAVAPFKAHINYIPPIDRVGLDQARTYRYLLAAGNQLAVTLTPLTGDPDLYIWPPNPNAPPYVSNLSDTAVDRVTLTATENGEYQIEVYGYEDAEYQLTVQVNAASAVSVRSSPESGDPNPDKEELTAPILNRDSTPSNRQALPTAPTLPELPPTFIFLPTIAR